MCLIPTTRLSLLLLFLCLNGLCTSAQEGYEIQVYGSATMAPHYTIFELHSNLSPSGPRNQKIGYTHPDHETLEITTGITRDFELGVYFFNRINQGKFEYIGSHIRPRVKAPEEWKWSWGASLSGEFGFVKDPTTQTTSWDYEIRPIFDRTIGKNYISLNPSFDGVVATQEFSFSPNIKYSYLVDPKYAIGIEYYGSFGKPFRWDPTNVQTHQVYAVADLFLDPKYEVIFGVGRGITVSSDRWNVRLILGRRVHWGKPAPNPSS